VERGGLCEKKKVSRTLSSPRNPLTAEKESNGRTGSHFGTKEQEIKVDRFIFETERTLSCVEKERERKREREREREFLF